MAPSLAGLLVLGAFALLGGLAPLIAPYDPALPTGPAFAGPSADHWFGTNDIGQDLFSEWVWGARVSLGIALVVTVISTGLSWLVGLGSGIRWPGAGLLTGLTDLLLALPGLLLLIVVVTFVGPSSLAVALTLGVLSWPAFARIVRAEVLAIRAAPFVDAARAVGATEYRIVFRHVLPATRPLLPTKLVLTARYAIFSEATLAFLGLGDPAIKSWGSMLGWAFSDPLLFLRDGWWWRVGPPAIAIVLVVVAVSWIANDG